MPRQVYECPNDGEWEIILSFDDEIPALLRCPRCEKNSLHILKPPFIIVEGGTGAGRGNNAVRKQLAWDTKANEQQHDPYTQAKYQAEHTYNAAKDLGGDVPKITEEGLQSAAQAIADGGQRKSAEQRFIESRQEAHRKAKEARDKVKVD